MKQYVDETCIVLCVDNGKTVVAEMLYFKEHACISVSLNRSLRLDLAWNGQVYVANNTGLTFTSDGPAIRTVNNLN